MSGSGRKGYPECPGVVSRPSRMVGSGGRPLEISGSCRENLRDGRKLSRGPPGYPADVERPSQISGSGLETLLDLR